MSDRADRLVLGLTLLWTIVLLAAVTFLQQALFWPSLRALADSLLGLGVALWLGAAALGLGWALLRALALPASPGEQWTLAALLGLGTLGLAWLWIGMVRLPPPWLTALLLTLPLAALWRWRGPQPTLPPLSRYLWLLLAPLAFFSLTQALAPAASFDAYLYHLRLPELWLAEGSLFQAQKESAFHFPVLVHALITPAFQLGEAAAGVVTWFFFPLILALLWQLTRRFLPQTSAPLTLLLALTIQLFPLLAGWIYMDLALATFQLATLWALLHWWAEPGSRWDLVAGGCAGLAIGVKYLSVLTPLMALAFVLLVGRRDALRPLVRVALVTGLVGGGSYLRNLLATGNPLFPFLLPSPYWDDFRAAWYAAAGSGIGWSLPELVMLPLTATLGLRDTSYYDARPGPLLAGLTPLALWALARGQGSAPARRTLLPLLAFAGGYILLWVVGVMSSAALWQGRFLLTPLLLLCPVVAWAIGEWEQRSTERLPAGAMLWLVVGGWAGIMLLITGMEWVERRPLDALFGPPDAWRMSQLGDYEALTREAATLPADARLRLWFEPRSYRLPPSAAADLLLYEFSWRLHQAGGEIKALSTQLCAEGVSHVAIWWRGAHFMNEEPFHNPLPDQELAALEAWAGAQQRVWESPSAEYELLRLACPRR